MDFSHNSILTSSQTASIRRVQRLVSKEQIYLLNILALFWSIYEKYDSQREPVTFSFNEKSHNNQLNLSIKSSWSIMKTWILPNGQVTWFNPFWPFDQAYYPQNVQLPTANRFFYLEKQVKVLWFSPRWRNLFNLTMHFLGNMGRGHTLAVQIKIQLDWKSHSRINDLHSPEPLFYIITVIFVVTCKIFLWGAFCCEIKCPFEI